MEAGGGGGDVEHVVSEGPQLLHLPLTAEVRGLPAPAPWVAWRVCFSEVRVAGSVLRRRGSRPQSSVTAAPLALLPAPRG